MGACRELAEELLGLRVTLKTPNVAAHFAARYASHMAELTFEKQAKKLVKWHFFVDTELLEIWILAPPVTRTPEIRLLEVTSRPGASERVDAFRFTPSGDITYPSVVAEVTQTEMQLIKDHLLDLPEGWTLDGAQRTQRTQRRGRPKRVERAA